METLKSIFGRRSVRKYTGEGIDRDKLLTLAKAAIAAPSSQDTRHFRITIVDDYSVIEKLLEGLPYSKMLETAKHAIIVASDLSVAYGGFEIDYWLQDCAAAAENVLISAKDLGLGTCWTGVHPREDRVVHVQKTLGLPENVRPLCVIAVGIPAGENNPRDKFDPSFVSWNKWENQE